MLSVNPLVYQCRRHKRTVSGKIVFNSSWKTLLILYFLERKCEIKPPLGQDLYKFVGHKNRKGKDKFSHKFDYIQNIDTIYGKDNDDRQ